MCSSQNSLAAYHCVNSLSWWAAIRFWSSVLLIRLHLKERIEHLVDNEWLIFLFFLVLEYLICHFYSNYYQNGFWKLMEKVCLSDRCGMDSRRCHYSFHHRRISTDRGLHTSFEWGWSFLSFFAMRVQACLLVQLNSTFLVAENKLSFKQLCSCSMSNWGQETGWQIRQSQSRASIKRRRYREEDYMDPKQGLCLGAIFDIAATNVSVWSLGTFTN